jgi:two-component system, NarL family, sensor kinase
VQTYSNQVIFFLIISTATILSLVGLIVALIYLYQKKQIAYQQQLSAMKLDYDKNLLTTQIEIQESTFQHISREIHDNISLSLTLAKLSLNTLDWSNHERVMVQTNSSLEQITKAITDLNDISKSLDSELILNQGLIKALQRELGNIKEIQLFDLEFKITGDPVFMDSHKELIIFRIIQEGLKNIIKHARATLVQLQLNYGDSKIEIFLNDNGIGFCREGSDDDNRMKSKAGLNNIRNRAMIFNGSAAIESRLGQGTSIFVTMPY